MLGNIKRFIKKVLASKDHNLEIYRPWVEVKLTVKKPSYRKYKNLPITNNKIVFKTFNGSYSCNPKYIAEEIIRQNLPYELVWVVNNNILSFIDDFPREKIKLVMANSSDDYKETVSAKIVIDNERRMRYTRKGFVKRDGQIFIQTFHGSLGIKKTGVDRNDFAKNQLRLIQKDSAQIDYLTSNSRYTSDFFKRMFFGYGKILEIGHPRNDVFFRDNENIKKKVCDYFGIASNKKIIMYAPTLRENHSFMYYSLDLEAVVQAVTNKFGGEWVVIVRVHPLLLDKRDLYFSSNPTTTDGTQYSDMQELLAATDLLISDYSSCIYDYMLSYKPGFIFATDLRDYDEYRGFYYPLSDTPFPIATSNDELVRNIETFDHEEYKLRVKSFLDRKGVIETGHASEQVVELIKHIIG